MQIGNLIRVWGAPLEGREFEIPPWYLCVIREIVASRVIVQTPTGHELTFNMSDVEVVDT